MMRIAFILLAILLCAHCTVAQPLGFTIEGGKSRVEIPIEIHNNLIVVPVILNEMMPLRFIVDTGVRTSILTQKVFSDILNLPYSRKYTIAGPGGEKLIDAYVTNNVTLQLPGVTGKGHALLVLDEDYLELRNYLGTDVHGILGYELFSRFIVKIDYHRKVLTLLLPDRFRKRKGFETIPITIEDTKPYVVAPVVMADGRLLNAKLLMDTGASHGLMLDPASSDQVHVPEKVVQSLIGRGLGGEITGKVGRIKSVTLGDFYLENVIATFPDPNSYLDTLLSGRVARHGTLGGEIFSRFTMIFNFSKEEVYLKKNDAFKKDFHYNLSGITVRAKGARLNIFEITEIRAESVAETAGVQPGDIITSINGNPTLGLRLNDLHGYFNSRPGRKIRLEIKRGESRVKKEFILKDQI